MVPDFTLSDSLSSARISSGVSEASPSPTCSPQHLLLGSYEAVAASACSCIYPRVKINIRREAKFPSEELAAHAMTKELAFNGAFIIHSAVNYSFKLLMESFIKNFCIHTRFWVEALKKPLG